MRVELGSRRLPGRPSCGLLPVALLAAGCLAGCGHTQQYAYPGTRPSAYVGASTVATQVPVEKVEVENDGLPAQAAPRAGIRQLPDDPREPWSRNYGGPAPQPVRRADVEPLPSGANRGTSAVGGVVGGYPVPVGPPPPSSSGIRPVAVAQQGWVATTR